MSAIIIDNRGAARTDILRDALQAAGCEILAAYSQVWGNGVQGAWNDNVAGQARQCAADADVIFLHANNPRVVEGLRDAFSSKRVVCYSGGSISNSVSSMIDLNPLHCCFKQRISDDKDAEIEWDLRAYMDAVQNNQPDACERLNSLDQLLEAELNFFYESLDACNRSEARDLMRTCFEKVEKAADNRLRARPDLSVEIQSKIDHVKALLQSGLNIKPSELLGQLRNVLLGE